MGSVRHDGSVPAFVPGVELARGLYEEVVGPAIGSVPHSAARLGWGSDVLGYDTERSIDHGWGPALQVFVDRDDAPADLRDRLAAALPEEFRGWPTRYGWDRVPVSHHVEVHGLGPWLEAHLGFDPTVGVSGLDWLATPQQLLLEVTAGAVFHDGLGRLGPLRERLAWYPDQVWLWLLACQWGRIAQEEPFAGRAAEVGDELGSRLVSARLARDLVRLALLQERRYAPYTKWLGSAFARLDVASGLTAHLEAAVAAPGHGARERALVEALEVLARRHNDLGLTRALDARTGSFHGRPFRVLMADRFVEACREAITDPWLMALPPVGAVDQFADSTDVLSDAARARRLATCLLSGERNRAPSLCGDA
jgi:hypothetical protein